MFLKSFYAKFGEEVYRRNLVQPFKKKWSRLLVVTPSCLEIFWVRLSVKCCSHILLAAEIHFRSWTHFEIQNARNFLHHEQCAHGRPSLVPIFKFEPLWQRKAYNLLDCALMPSKTASEAAADGSMRTMSFPSLRPSNSICSASAAFPKSDKDNQ